MLGLDKCFLVEEVPMLDNCILRSEAECAVGVFLCELELTLVALAKEVQGEGAPPWHGGGCSVWVTEDYE